MSHAGAKLRNTLEYLRTHGLRRFGREVSHQLSNAFHERRLGVNTASVVRLADIGVHQQDSRDSMPIGYAAFYAALERLPVDRANSTFLDYGVGKGRAVCAAAVFRFRRIIGVDISQALIEEARANVGRMKHRRTANVELRQVDATAFEVPEDVNVIYFYNPFTGETLRRVTANIAASWRRHPRKIHLLFFNNDHFDRSISGERWLTKTHEAIYYPEISCGFYETPTTSS